MEEKLRTPRSGEVNRQDIRTPRPHLPSGCPEMVKSIGSITFADRVFRIHPSEFFLLVVKNK
jgi:hypothetical protein